MNFYKKSYQLILRYLYIETIKRRDEISLHRYFQFLFLLNEKMVSHLFLNMRLMDGLNGQFLALLYIITNVSV